MATGTRSKLMVQRWSNPEYRQRMVQLCRQGRAQSTKYSEADEAIRIWRATKQRKLAQVVHERDCNR